MPTPIKVGRKERMSFAKIHEVCEMPNLIDVQTKSYKWFVEEGLGEVLDDVSPIRDTTNTLSLEFADYHFSDTPKYDQEECKERDATYATALTVKVRLINRETGEIKEQDVFMGDFPLMTEKGTFVYNGAERAIVTQMVRSPGPYYDVTTDKSNQRLYSSQVIPNRGAWLEYETDSQGILYVRVDRTRKQPLTSFLRALGIIDPEALQLSSNEDIIALFGDDQRLQNTLEKDTTKNSADGLRELYRRLRPGEPPTVENARSMLMALLFDERRYDLAKVGRFKYNRKLGLANRLVDTVAAEDIIDPNTGEVLVEDGGEISRSMAMVIEDAGVKSVLVHSKNEDEQDVVTKVIGNNFVDPAQYVNIDLTPYRLSEKVFYPALMDIIEKAEGDEDKLKAGIANRRNKLSDQPQPRRRRDRRHRPPEQQTSQDGRRAAAEPVQDRIRKDGEDDQREDDDRELDSSAADKYQACNCGHQGVLRIFAAVAVHGPEQPAGRAHSQEKTVGSRTWRTFERKSRHGSQRRTLLPLRKNVPDRDS